MYKLGLAVSVMVFTNICAMQYENQLQLISPLQQRLLKLIDLPRCLTLNELLLAKSLLHQVQIESPIASLMLENLLEGKIAKEALVDGLAMMHQRTYLRREPSPLAEEHL